MAPSNSPNNGTFPGNDMAKLAINTIRTLSMDAVQKADSGHPGAPMALAPAIYELWQHHLNFDPEDPIWPGRDRFILSNGHASMLLYSMLYLTGVKAVDDQYELVGAPSVTLDDIKNFRQLGSKCPGHPEYHLTTGVEVTTGPLGQGISTAVGIAAAQQWLAAHYDKDGSRLFDYRIHVFCGDGDLMEGISSEACSLAGHLKLSSLCVLYDSNHISIEGSTSLAFDENVGERFAAYGWNVLHVEDVNDRELLRKQYEAALRTQDRPTLIIAHSEIGYGSPNKQGKASAHGEPLGAEEVRLTKKQYGWPEDSSFLVPPGVIEHFHEGFGARGKKLREEWYTRFEEYGRKHPELAREIRQMQSRELPEGWDRDLPPFTSKEIGEKGMATREASGKVLNTLAKRIPWLLGGSADLAPSTKTRLTFDGAGDFSPKDRGGRNFHFGVREHAMGAFVNGLSLSKLRPYGSTFLIFSDYCKPALRLSSIMELPVVYIFTHDSIGVGEDGPTHQPIEQLAALRAIPGFITLRPADANEVLEAWKVVLSLRHEPAALVLTRQNLPLIDRARYAPASGVAKGAYVLAGDAKETPDVILIATGSEVSLCLEAFDELNKQGVRARVVSMPSWELFERQNEEYRESVLPKAVSARVSVEQAATFGWERYVGDKGALIGMKSFGASAPLKHLLKKFGFTKEAVVAAALAQAKRR